MRLPAPQGKLTLLGDLTRLRYRAFGGVVKTARWALRSAPSLVYDDRGRLFIAYDAAPMRPATPPETREYTRTHWGDRGAVEVLTGHRALAPVVTLGEGVDLTYTTSKAGELADWTHAWGDGFPRPTRWQAPSIVTHRCGIPGCPMDHAIALVGGTYRVTSRGIVG